MSSSVFLVVLQRARRDHLRHAVGRAERAQQISRNERSVAPAIGASAATPFSVRFPIFIALSPSYNIYAPLGRMRRAASENTRSLPRVLVERLLEGREEFLHEQVGLRQMHIPDRLAQRFPRPQRNSRLPVFAPRCT